MTEINLSGSRILLTGACGGIGLAVCQGLLDCGANVLTTDLKINPELESLISNSNGQLSFEPCDLMDDEALENLLNKTSSWGCNGLINNAALFDMTPLWESDLDQYDRIFNVNVRAMFRLMQGISDDLRIKESPGKIINFSSQAGRRGEALVSHYCASKAAVISYTQSAALALAPYGINVNAIAPGVVDTPMWVNVDALFAKYENLELGEKKKQVGESVPIGRMGLPQDVVGAVLFLASNLSDYITGQTLNVDGGNVMS